MKRARRLNYSKDGKGGRTTGPIPCTGESEESSVKRTDEELKGVKDDNSDIQVSKVMEFCLLQFDTGNGVVDLWERQAACTEN